MKFIDENQRQLLAKTLLDFSKIMLAAAFASEFFIRFSPKVKMIIFVLFIIAFSWGIYFGKKEEE